MEKRLVLLMIEDGRNTSKEVKAFSKESANISITAPTMQEALTLLQECIPEAQEAAANWTPEPEPAPEEKPAVKYRTVEDDMADFEATAAGKRFIKGLQNSRQFYFENGNGGLRCSELDYLACKYHNSLIDGSFDIYSYAYNKS
mgnify:CR=1 FL=1